MNNKNLSRRDFLKPATVSGGAWAFRPMTKLTLPEFLQGQANHLGRITVGKMDAYARPDAASLVVDAFYEDRVMPWIREAVGSMPGRVNQRFVETPDGFIWVEMFSLCGTSRIVRLRVCQRAVWG